MFSLLQAHIAFLKEVSKSVDEAKFQAVRQQHVSQLTKSLVNMSKQADIGDTTKSLQILKDGPFNEEDCATLTNVILGVGSMSTSEISSTRVSLKQQTHLNFNNYLTEADWRTLCNRAVDRDYKVDLIVRRCMAIGLLSMTEKTARYVTAVLVVSHGEQCSLPECYDLLQKVKTAVKKHREHRSDKVVATMATFPSDVKDFMQSFPNAYSADDQPVASQVDGQVVSDLSAAMPARKTHSAMASRSLIPARGGGGRSSHEPTLEYLLPLAQAIASQQSNGGRLAIQGCMGASPKGCIGASPTAHREPTAIGQASPHGHLALLDANHDPSHVEASADDPRERPPAEPSKDVGLNGAPAKTPEVEGATDDLKKSPGLATHTKSAAEAAMAVQLAIAKKKEMSKEKSKAKAKAKRKNEGASEPSAPMKRPAASIAPPSAAAAASGAAKRPKTPSLENVPPIRYLSCKIYSSSASRKWRAVSSKNTRYDKSFAWMHGQSSWDACLAWCEANTE